MNWIKLFPWLFLYCYNLKLSKQLSTLIYFLFNFLLSQFFFHNKSLINQACSRLRSNRIVMYTLGQHSPSTAQVNSHLQTVILERAKSTLFTCAVSDILCLIYQPLSYDKTVRLITLNLYLFWLVSAHHQLIETSSSQCNC